MKGFFMALPAVFLLGVLIGGWGARDELFRERANAEKEKAARRADGRIGFDAFAKALNLPDKARGPRRARGGPPARLPPPDSGSPKTNAYAAANSATNAPESADAARGPWGRRRRMRPENLAARIEEAKELWSARVEIARANAVKRLGLNANGEKAFDEAVARMNRKLAESVNTVAARIADDEKFTPELGVRLMGDLGISLAETYDELGAVAGEGARVDVSELNLVDFVDPSVAEPLIGVQDKIVRPIPEGR